MLWFENVLQADGPSIFVESLVQRIEDDLTFFC